MSKQTVVVFGATGKQGGSVVESILADSKAAARFHVKAVTRDVTKDSAKALAAKGAELVTADLADKDSLRAAIKGAWGVFAVTNFWEHFKAELEVQQGKNIADVSKEEGVQHLVWSSLLNVNKLTNGVLSEVYHFDSKADVEEYIRSIGIPATFFLPGFYLSNIPGANLSEFPDGKWGLALPLPEDAPIPIFAAEKDTGKFVKAIFLKETPSGKRVYGATTYATPLELLATFKETYPEVGAQATFKSLPHEVFKGILASRGVPAAAQEELLQNFRLIGEFGYYGGESLDSSTAIVDEPLTTWKEYMQASPALAGAK